MTSPGSHILPRDAESGSNNNNLTTGAIAGIACGAGALFLGAAGLFAIYYRRQRRFDREDNSDGDSFDDARPPPAMAPAGVSYTMDYKMDDPQHHEGDQGSSSYTYSPEKPCHSISPRGAPEKARAMPTHPAYIPRALVRGSTPSNRSAASASPFPSPPFPSSTSHPKTKPDDTVVQAYLAAAVEAAQTTTTTHSSRPSQAQDARTLSRESGFSISGLPDQPRPRGQTRQSPTQIPALIIPPNPDTTGPPQSQNPPIGGGGSQPRKPRAYPPPRLNLNPTAPAPAPAPQLPPPPMPNHTTRTGDKPLQGKENSTISGPLAFPEHIHYHPGPQPGGAPSHGGNRPKPGWTRGSEPEPSPPAAAAAAEEEDDPYDFYDNPSPPLQYHPHPQHHPQTDNRRTFRSRALTGGSGSGNGGAEERDREKEKEKAKKNSRRRSDRNSGGGGGGGGNRHYAEIEIGRGSDIW